MIPSSRSSMLTLLAALVLAVGGLPACHKADKKKVLESLVREVVAPATVEVSARSKALQAAVDQLAAMPAPATLAAARAAWRPAAVAWKRALTFRNGPIVQDNAVLRAAFWPARPAAIQAVLDDGKTIDDQRMELLGADAVGLYALEQVLFGAAGADPAHDAALLGPGGVRRRLYAQALAEDIATHARVVSEHLGPEGVGFGATFAAPGQESLNKLVNQMVQNIEALAAGRLALVLELQTNGMLKPAEVEGWPSGASRDLAAAQLAGTEALYRGADGRGIADLVRAAAPGVDGRVQTAFDGARGKMEKVTAPLETVVTQDRPTLAAASTAAKELELALKVDMANALGVTLTFAAGDGD